MAPSKRWRWAMLLAKEKQPRPAKALDQEAPHSDGLFASGLKSNVSSKNHFLEISLWEVVVFFR